MMIVIKRVFMMLVLSCCSAAAQGTIQHIIYISLENRSFDELFGTLPGVQNYCRGGHSPIRCTNNQSTSCTIVGTHDVCGPAWCEPIQCTTPAGPECSVGDTCPQIATYITGDGEVLRHEAPTQIYGDTPHTQAAFLKQLANGAMNGWPTGASSLHYFRQADIPYRYQLATRYGLADNHFSSIGGPSQPGHAMMFAADSHASSDNPTTTMTGAMNNPGEIGGFGHAWTCGAYHTGSSVPYLYTGTLISVDATDGTQFFAGTNTTDRTKACTCRCPAGTQCGVSTFTSSPCADKVNGGWCDVNRSLGGTPGAPCPAITTLADLAESNGVTWGYYSFNSRWNAAAQFQQIYFNSARWANHIHHDNQFDIDASSCSPTSCSLPQLVWMSPDAAVNSEHPGDGTLASGESWLKSRLRSFFSNPYLYAHSIVFITWDDWGGAYDHVPPPQTDNLPSLGMRVPLICAGPYCRNQITHTQFEFASVLRCMEKAFGLPTLNSRDAGAADACAGKGTLLSNTDGMVDLSQSPIPPIL